MEYFNQIKNQFVDFWKAVDASTKLLIMGMGVVLVIALVVAVMLNQNPSMGLLYANLTESDAALIVSELEDQNVEYTLKNQGRDIYVTKSRVNNVKLSLREKDLPKGGKGTGFEIFDKSQFGVTDFAQNIQYRRALEGELSRTISSIAGITAARVHINIPKERLFRNEKSEASATVFVKLKTPGSLNQAQVRSIQQMAASAIDRLSVEQVTVVDNFGNILGASGGTDTVSGLLSNRVGVQKDVENYYIRKVQGLLDAVLGRGNSIVRVDAKLDFDKVEETEEKFDPESAVVRSETITTEKESGSSASAKGPPGVQSNMVPGGGKNKQNEQESQSSREVINNSYEIDRKVRHIIKGVGDLKKLTVSVFIHKKEGDGSEPKGGSVEAFTEIVKNAIGFDEERGDSVVVREIPFSEESQQGMVPVEYKEPINIGQLIQTGSQIIFLFGVFFLFRTILRKEQSTRRRTRVVVSEEGEKDQGPNKKEEQKKKKEREEKQIEEDLIELESLEKGAFIDTKINKIVTDYNEESEQVLKNWLRE